MRFHSQTAGVSLTAQQPLNNIVRTATEALSAVLGGTQSLHTNSYDEALALPTEEAVRVALRTQQIIAHETGVTNTIDPLGGSYFVEALTDRMEEAAYAEFRKIDELGGMVEAIKQSYPQREIADASFRLQEEIERGERVIVGVNRYQQEDEREPRDPAHPGRARAQADRPRPGRAGEPRPPRPSRPRSPSCARPPRRPQPDGAAARLRPRARDARARSSSRSSAFSARTRKRRSSRALAAQRPPVAFDKGRSSGARPLKKSGAASRCRGHPPCRGKGTRDTWLHPNRRLCSDSRACPCPRAGRIRRVEVGDAGDLRATANDMGAGAVTQIKGTFTDAPTRTSTASACPTAPRSPRARSAATPARHPALPLQLAGVRDLRERRLGRFARLPAAGAASLLAHPRRRRILPGISAYNRDPQSSPARSSTTTSTARSTRTASSTANGFGAATPLAWRTGRAPGRGPYRITLTGTTACDTTPPAVDLRSPADGAHVRRAPRSSWTSRARTRTAAPASPRARDRPPTGRSSTRASSARCR